MAVAVGYKGIMCYGGKIAPATFVLPAGPECHAIQQKLVDIGALTFSELSDSVYEANHWWIVKRELMPANKLEELAGQAGLKPVLYETGRAANSMVSRGAIWDLPEEARRHEALESAKGAIIRETLGLPVDTVKSSGYL